MTADYCATARPLRVVRAVECKSLMTASAVCATAYTPTAPLAQPQDGVGLFTSLTFQGQNALIAYQLRTAGAGQLYGVGLGANNLVSPPVLLDGTDDTGYFPNVKVSPSGQVALSYQDWTTRALKFYTAASFKTGVTPEVIDTGAGEQLIGHGQ